MRRCRRLRATWLVLVVSGLVVGLGPAAAEAQTPCPVTANSCLGGAVVDGGVEVAVGVRDGAAGTEGSDSASGAGAGRSRCDDTQLGGLLTSEERDRLIAAIERRPAEPLEGPRLRGGWRHCDGLWELYWRTEGDDASDDADLVRDALEEAFDRVVPGVPVPVTSPPASAGALTGLPLYLAVEDTSATDLIAQVSAGPFRVTATLEPAELVTDPGDGSAPIVCPSPGQRWAPGDRPAPGDCTHTYTELPADGAATFPLTMHVTYRATYTVEGPVLAGTYSLGVIDGPATTHALPVRERRAVRGD